MNDILNRGFVSPYIKFNFSSGTIDTIPPRYFISFEQDRSVDQACSFNLVLKYVPGNYNEDTASLMHQLLLTSVNKPVSYQYGYVTPRGGLQLQDNYYTGIFTQYTESLDTDGLTYTISGVGKSVAMVTPTINVEDFLASRKRGANSGGSYDISHPQPSTLVSHLIEKESDVAQYFNGWNIHIEHTDERVDINSINIKNGPIRDVFAGSYNADETKNITGFVSYSNMQLTEEDVLSSSLISEKTARDSNVYNTVNRYASYLLRKPELDSVIQAHNEMNRIRKTPFVCYFDNVVDSMNSNLMGSFYYVPKYNRQVTNIFTYNYGNNFIDSDVLRFDVTNDCTVAMATIGSLNTVSTSIGCTGEALGSSYNALQSAGFVKNTYNTISGFNESVFFTESTIARALDFPFEATMDIIGQTQCNKLLDCIRVNVFVNGVEHPNLSGDYVIMSIKDSLSDSGFTTTFTLLKEYNGSDSPEKILQNAKDSVQAQVEKAFQNDYK